MKTPYDQLSQGKIQSKYRFASTNEALKREIKCKCIYPNCKKHFEAPPYKTGFDIEYCTKHRAEMKEEEADRMYEQMKRDNPDFELDPELIT